MKRKRSAIRSLFERANRLWFFRGSTGRALSLYRQALDKKPDDPVVWYQFACALGAMGQFDEARDALVQADRYGDHLSEFGQKKLREETAGMREGVMLPGSPDVGNTDMDIEVLDKRPLSTRQWYRVALVARERGMLGLSSRALERSTGEFVDADVLREVEEVRYEAELKVALLKEMRAGPPSSRAGESRTRPGSEGHKRQGGRRDVTGPPAQPRPAPPPQEAQRSDVAESMAELSGLRLEVTASPVEAPPGEQIRLTARLTNVGDETLVINGRMLLNRPDAPVTHGEIVLDVEGPRDYDNEILFTVRVGEPKDEDFRLLEAGGSVERVYRLWKYHSLHVPGRYRLQLTYRNAVGRPMKGVPAVVGSVRSNPISVIVREPLDT